MAHVDLPTGCPQCGNPTTAPLTTGFRLCPACTLEWDPADPPTFERVPDAVVEEAIDAYLTTMGREPTYDVDDDTPADPFAEWLGTDVVLVDGRTGTVVGFPDDDSMLVVLADNDTVKVEFNDVRGSATPEPVAVASDEQQEQMGRTALMLAGLTLQAAATALEDSDEYTTVLNVPPTGWAPDDPDILPLVEMGAAYAAATLAVAIGFSSTYLEELAQRLLRDAQHTETETVEGTPDDQ